MTVKELIEMLKTCDEESIVYIDYNGDINSINEVCDYSNNCGEVNSINANGLYVIRKAGSNRAGFIKFDD